ncbi:uncharacterized protein LOC124168852 isoform X2 [Ischnura elegans]|uniref:uncharacterized protein LOC124168852 isoform X2 n=1 Tax=Ischnura elegans TaxID=197161 RepID=UPI001ED8AA13|nr:uncharacterized protein LOC124168852 isoform X2 [Ischnura elegans]
MHMNGETTREKAGGGVVVDEGASENSDAITISSGSIAPGKGDVISSSYIYISCFYGALISLEECRLIPHGSDDGDTISEEYGTDKLKTGMSVKEMHQLLVYLRNNKCLWKEVAKKKICGNWSWKSVQQDFTIWALKRFKDMVSACPENECGSNMQEQSEAGSHEENLPSCSKACSDSGHHVKSVCGEDGAERQQDSASEGCDEKERSSNQEEAQAKTSGNEEEMSAKRVCDSEEDDISLSTLRKRVAGRQSVVVDDASMSEEEENTSRALKAKNNEVSESGKGGDEGEVVGVGCSAGKQVDSLPMAVDEGNTSKERENVISLASEANDCGPSLKDKGCDEDCVVQYEKIAMRKVKAKGVLGRNYSVPCNQWLRKDDAWGSIGEVATSTPVSRPSNESESGSSDGEGESGSGERSKAANDTTSKRTIPYHQRLYSYKEDMRILMWLCCKRKRGFDSLKGNRIWQFMESKSVVPGRSWQSLRERFRRHIVPNLNSYQIPPEEKKKLLRQCR